MSFSIYLAIGNEYQIKHSLRTSLAELMSKQNSYSTKDRIGMRGLSESTKRKRAQAIFRAFQALSNAGFKIEKAESLRLEHVHALVKCLQERGQTFDTVDNTLSYLRTVCKWLGKGRMIPPLSELWGVPGVTRKRVAVESKCWQDLGIDTDQLIGRVMEVDLVVGFQLRLQQAFGLRARESWLFQPCLALERALDKARFRIERGTKAGLSRPFYVRELVQLEVLAAAAELATSRNGTMIPKRYTLKQWSTYYYRVMRKCGILKSTADGGLGVTSHGLRHEYANSRFEAILGKPSPLHGGFDYSPGLYLTALRVVVQDLGHSALRKAGAYLGGLPSFDRLKNAMRMVEEQEERRLAVGGASVGTDGDGMEGGQRI